MKVGETLGRETWLIELGAVVYLTGRVSFLPLYAAAVRWLRTFSWNIATVGLAMAMVGVVLPPA